MPKEAVVTQKRAQGSGKQTPKGALPLKPSAAAVPVKPATAAPKAAPAKAKPAEKRKKARQPNGIQRWWAETLGELGKVTWPTLPETWRMTRIVLVVMLLTGVLLGGLDFLFSRLIAMLLA
jgi:preprotein translocase subunit SecE